MYERLSCLLKLYNAADRRVKYSHLLVNALVPEWFILRRKFMADPVKYKTWRYDMSNFEKICDWYRVDLHAGMSSREIFNRLIEKNGRSSIPMIFVIWSIWPIIAGLLRYYPSTNSVSVNLHRLFLGNWRTRLWLDLMDSAINLYASINMFCAKLLKRIALEYYGKS